MGKSMPFKGTMSENITKAMLGIREKDGKAVVYLHLKQKNILQEKKS